MSKLLSLVDWLWVKYFVIKGQCCMFLYERMNCLLWYVLLRRLYTVLPCIYERFEDKCFIERCSDVCCFSESKRVRKSDGDFMEMDFSVIFLPQGLQPYDITVMAIDTPQHVLYESCNTMHHCTLLLCSLPFKRLL